MSLPQLQTYAAIAIIEKQIPYNNIDEKYITCIKTYKKIITDVRERGICRLCSLANTSQRLQRAQLYLLNRYVLPALEINIEPFTAHSKRVTLTTPYGEKRTFTFIDKRYYFKITSETKEETELTESLNDFIRHSGANFTTDDEVFEMWLNDFYARSVGKSPIDGDHKTYIPLFIAARRNNLIAAQWLVHNGAKPKIYRRDKGCSPVDVAKENEYAEMTNLLENSCAS